MRALEWRLGADVNFPTKEEIMKSKLVASALLGLALAVLAPGRTHIEPAAGASRAHAPQTIVPYLSHGAGVWVERTTGRPVSIPGSGAAPATPGVHYLRP
jgi:hypothetical protein